MTPTETPTETLTPTPTPTPTATATTTTTATSTPNTHGLPPDTVAIMTENFGSVDNFLRLHNQGQV